MSVQVVSRIASPVSLRLRSLAVPLTALAMVTSCGSDPTPVAPVVQPFSGNAISNQNQQANLADEQSQASTSQGNNSDGQMAENMAGDVPVVTDESGQTATQLDGSADNSAEDGIPGVTEDSSAPNPLETPAGFPRGLGPAITGDSELLLGLSTRFYGAQRSGDGANWLLDGQSCHMNDGESIDTDLSGGWYDAGDHVKVTISIAYAAYLMLKGYDAYPDAFADNYGERYEQGGNGVPDVLDEVRYATDYLVKAHVSENQLVGMVGTTGPDHDTWSTCVVQEDQLEVLGGRPRRVSLEANADIAGLTAGTLAAMARLYAPFDAELSARYLTHATQIYQIGLDNQSTSNPGLYQQLGNAWIDEMLVGSAEMYVATQQQSYLDDALGFNTQLENHGWAPNYSQAADFARHSLFVAGQSDAVGEFWGLDIANYQAQVSATQFTDGMIFFNDWGSLRYAAGAAFSAALYFEVTGDDAARALATGQLNYIMGDNSYNRSFVVGFGENPPEQPHHRNAQGTGDLDVFPFVHTLSGALVGGPSNTGVGVTAPGYEDDVNDYVSNEVALDYNAGLVGLSAFGTVERRAQ